MRQALVQLVDQNPRAASPLALPPIVGDGTLEDVGAVFKSGVLIWSSRWEAPRSSKGHAGTHH